MQDIGQNDVAGNAGEELPASGRAGGMTRRNVLRMGAIAAGAATLAGLGAGTATAAQGRQIRRELSFDEGWRFFRGAAPGGEAESFDDSGWRVLDLPHDWSIEDLPGGADDGGATADPALTAAVTDPSLELRAPARIGPHDKNESAGGKLTGYTVGGEGWYRKHFRVDDLRAGDQALVRFDGIYWNSDVWINGHHLGWRPNGYVGIHYDLTPHLRRDGENVLAVRVRNLGVNARWYSGSGIYRHTWLTTTGPVRIPQWGVAITTPVVARDRSRVKSVVEVQNKGRADARVRVRCTLLDPAGRTVGESMSDRRSVKPGDATTYAFEQWVPEARLWSPESPSLYRARMEVLVGGEVVDVVEETFGIRSIVMNDKGFFLNGASRKMRGANIHHDHGPLGAMALDRSEERRVQILKDAGFNAIRSSHNPPNPALLAACDRLGMLVYDEIFDVWDYPKFAADDYSNYFAEWWQRDLTDWVLTGRNHPSIVIRSIGNEIELTRPVDPDNRLASRGAEISALLRRLDPTRPICQGGGQGVLEKTSQDRNPADEYTDVGDVHYHHSYGGKPAANPGKAWLQSESFPATMYDDYELMMAHDFAIGDFVWTGWDYLGESGIGTPLVGPYGSASALSPVDEALALAAVVAAKYPVHLAGCGDFDILGRPRPQLLYRRAVWGESPLELVVERPSPPGMEQQSHGWGWRDELESWTWDVPPAQLMHVHAYTAADAVKLLLDGEQVGEVALTAADRCSANFTVPYRPGELTAIAFKGDTEIARKTLATAGAPAALRLISDVPALTTARDDLAHVLVEVVDDNGRRVPDAIVKVDFSLTGGTLAAVANANRNNVDSFQRPRRWTYLGQAMAIIRPPKTAGTMTLFASAEGLHGTSISLKVVAPPK